MSASRMLSAKLLEPTTTVSPFAAPAVSSLRGSAVSSADPPPASRTVAAASATAATPGFFLRDLRCAAVKVTIPVPELRGCKGVQGRSRGEALALIQSSLFWLSQDRPGHNWHQPVIGCEGKAKPARGVRRGL